MREPTLPGGRGNIPIPQRVVCQVCGRAKAEDAAVEDGWLVAAWRIDPRYTVVRCYRHWSEWSLRCSAAGRTKENRAKMAEGRRRAEEEGERG